MIAVDTNVLLRYLLEPLDANNPNWQIIAARNVIDQADKVLITDIVIAEMEWVMESVFELSSEDIAHLIQTLANNACFQFEDWPALQSALMDYREYPHVDLSDCLIARRAKNQGASTLYTFESDKKLGALPCATSLKPPKAC